MLDRGITMKFVLELLQKMKPKSIHVAVLFNFVPVEDDDTYITGLYMPQKKWIVFPWETEIHIENGKEEG